jgi:hypothetical protein
LNNCPVLGFNADKTYPIVELALELRLAGWTKKNTETKICRLRRRSAASHASPSRSRPPPLHPNVTLNLRHHPPPPLPLPIVRSRRWELSTTTTVVIVIVNIVAAHVSQHRAQAAIIACMNVPPVHFARPLLALMSMPQRTDALVADAKFTARCGAVRIGVNISNRVAVKSLPTGSPPQDS